MKDGAWSELEKGDSQAKNYAMNAVIKFSNHNFD